MIKWKSTKFLPDEYDYFLCCRKGYNEKLRIGGAILERFADGQHIWTDGGTILNQHCTVTHWAHWPEKDDSSWIDIYLPPTSAGVYLVLNKIVDIDDDVFYKVGHYKELGKSGRFAWFELDGAKFHHIEDETREVVKYMPINFPKVK